MLTANTQFESELKKRIAEELARQLEILANPAAIRDYSDYRYHVGQIDALRMVVDAYCDEVTTAINQR